MARATAGQTQPESADLGIQGLATSAPGLPLRDNGPSGALARRPPPFAPVDSKPPRKLHPLPRGLVELYGLLAVLFVLVPEWMAGGALSGLQEGRQGSDLPMTAGAWRRVPELRLAAMSLAQLRGLARELRLAGYGRLNRERLTARLLRRIQAKP